MSQYDIICLNEIKTGLTVEFPGYVTYCSAVDGSAERGGTVVCVRNSIVNLVHSIDLSIGDQVWLKFKNLQGVLMGFCYIPPCDSPYYSHASFAAIQEKIISSNMTNGFIVIGDMNCRFGGLVRDLPARIRPTHLFASASTQFCVTILLPLTIMLKCYSMCVVRTTWWLSTISGPLISTF